MKVTGEQTIPITNRCKTVHFKTNIMIPSQKCIDLIKKFEGLKLASYKDGGGVWTIGYGSTMWTDGKRVKEYEVCNMETAEKLLAWEVNNKSKSVTAFLDKVYYNQNQFDALVSFAFNLGIGALAKSTLLKKVRKNPTDPEIRKEFLKWVNDNGKKIDGLVRRRTAEADLYFS